MKSTRFLILTFGLVAGMLIANWVRIQAIDRSLTDAVSRWSGEIDRRKARAALAAGANPNASHFKGISALTWAVRADDLETMRMLLDAGADPNDLRKSGHSLNTAATRGNAEAVKLLLDRGARINDTDEGRRSYALVLAVSKGHVPVVRLLLARGANPNSRSNYRGSVLQIARKQGPPQLVKLLKQAGARN